MEKIFHAAIELMGKLFTNLRRTPLFLWIYLAVLVYMFRRMSRDFLGMGTRSKKIVGKKTVSLTKDEESIAEFVIDPSSITQTFDDVCGLEDVKETLLQNVVWPFQHPEILKERFGSVLPRGVLLHGPPGTGKTMLARCLAKELDSFFLEVCVESLFSKFVGESEKLSAAVFSLAHKLEPCVIFVDEIDSLLGERTQSDNAVYTHSKTIFMTKWDGLSSEGAGNDRRIIVVGATNRLEALDNAVLRRLPIKAEVPLPDFRARELILKEYLAHSAADDFDYSAAAALTNGYSGSDLQELSKAASLVALSEVMKLSKASKPSRESVAAARVSLGSLKEAMRKVKSSSPSTNMSLRRLFS